MNKLTAEATIPSTGSITRKRRNSLAVFKRNWPLHVMLMPGVLLLLVFSYLPMAGIAIAFQNFQPYLGILKSEWIGFDHFTFLLQYDNFIRVTSNTLFFACSKIILNVAIPFAFALLLNEIRLMGYKRSIQTLVYLPHFISWVTLAGILIDILGQNGIVNQFIRFVFGIESILFLQEGSWFRFTVIVSDVWKEFGFNAIIFLAALSGINPALYESAEVDGATRWKQTLHITIPSLIPIMIVVGTLALGNVLNANFDQIFNLYNPLVYEQGDIIDTFVYRQGLLTGQFSLGTAVGLFKSFVGLILIVISYRLAYKFANYRIF
jgi:putative aldouronate transport system permease protein